MYIDCYIPNLTVGDNRGKTVFTNEWIQQFDSCQNSDFFVFFVVMSNNSEVVQFPIIHA